MALPVWWDPGTSYPLSATPAIIKAWEADNFDLLIFPHAEKNFVLPAIAEDVQSHYVLIPGTRFIDVYRQVEPF